MSGEPGLGGWVPRGAVDLRSPATAVSCCSQFGAEERGSVERSFASLLPGPGPHLYQHLDGTWPRPGQWGQREPGGCGQCGQQPSHAEPGHCPWKYRSPPSKRDVMVCFGDWASVRACGMALKHSRVRQEASGAEAATEAQMAKTGPGGAHP